MASTFSALAESDTGLNDLGPLAWVLDELRKSLDGATKAMHRFVRDAELARGSELSELDASHLRVARQQLHQAVGALEMVGMTAPARLLHAMESAVQKFVQRPELCSDDAATRIERASFALTEYLEGVLKGKNASSVALFPQYRAVMELSGAERIHPADLWPQEWRWLPVALNPARPSLAYAPEVRARLDQAVLKIVKTADPLAASRLAQLCAGLAADQSRLEDRSFWAIAAGYFQAMGQSLLGADIYTKRTASRILQQYAALARGESGPSERLAQDLVFFCAQAQAAPDQQADLLAAVRSAYGLSDSAPVDYGTEQFGRFDPAQLVLARKRIAAAAETWSALAGGDTHRIKMAGEQFHAVADSILKLHPKSSALSQALSGVIDGIVRSGEAPAPAVSMEVATSILYLEAAYADLDPTDDQMVERSNRLARRLQLVSEGAEPEPLEGWMEELYRRVSDRQTMGSVVDELRASLGEVEVALDQFFRNPADKAPLREVPSRLGQMRGVFSVLGLDQPSLAALRMRSSVDRLMVDPVDVVEARNGVFEKLGNSLGALGLLIDMLSYQRSMAKKLFVYDEDAGEFKPLMGRERSVPVPAAELPQPALDFAPVAPAPAAPAVVSPAPVAAAPQPADDEDDVDLQDIFLDEAREVVVAGLAAVRELAVDPSNLAEQTTLRRAFHTLKGSSRMVGLNDFGEAAWSFEQMFNAWLAEQKPASDALITLSGAAMAAFGRWIEDIARNTGMPWNAADFRASADAMRLHGQALALQVPGAPVPDAEPEIPAAFAPVAEPEAEPEATPEPHRPAEDEDAFAATRMVDNLQTELAPDFPDFLATQIFDGLPEFASEPAVASPRVEFEATQTFSLEALQALQDTQSRSAEPDATSALGDLDFGDLGLSLDLPAAPDSEPPAFALDFPPMPALADGEEQSADTEAPFEDGLSVEEEWLLEQELPQADERPTAIELPGMDVLEVGEEPPLAEVQPVDEAQPLAEDALPAAEELSQPEELPAGTAALSLQDEASMPPLAWAGVEIPAEAPATVLVEEPLPDFEADDQIKVIGDLRLSIPFYNVYLNEADEWSRRLLTELSEWSLELHRPILDSTVALAHSLGGSSATVGFTALSEVARALEHALEHVQLHDQGTAAHAQVFNDAAEDIRRLLHQFAAGFLKTCDARVLQELREIIDTEFAAPTIQPLDEEEDVYDTRSLLDADADADTQETRVLDLAELHDTALEPETELQTDFVPDPEPAPEAAEAVAEPEPELLQAAAPLAQPVLAVAAAPLQVAEAHDHDIDALDHLDTDLFPIFQEEALELMPALGTALRQWVARPDNLSARAEALRVLHTLKGSARLAGAMRLGEMAHRMESGIEVLGSEGLQTVQLEPLLARLDGLQATLDALDLAPRQDISKPAVAGAVADAALLPATVAPVAVEQVMRQAPRGVAGQSVRVRTQLLDRLVNQAGEVMISRARLDARVIQMRGALGELTGNLDRLRQQLRDVEVQAESQMQSRMAHTKEDAQGFDPLEFDRFTRVQELTRMMAESVNDVATVQRNLQRSLEGAEDDLNAQARQARELQRDLLRTRMVEFEGISERLYGVVRQAAKESGKQVKLDIVGGSIEMDRGVLDRMTPAFEHILRNAVAHGIEDAAVRVAAGKPAVGTITITVHQESNDVSVSFSDDGAGLQLDKIRAQALARKLIEPDAVLDDAAAAQLLFAPGFSTADAVTELSGRGIGMDVVQSEVNALGGLVETRTETGKGTQFRLVLPLTTAVTQVVMLRMGELSFGVPSNLIETVLRAPQASVDAAYASGQYDWDGQAIPFFWGGALLQVSGRSVEPQSRTLPVAVFRSAGQRLALHVDEVLGNREVVVKNLGPQLARLPGLAGMSVLASGAVVLIYNPVALATVYGAAARALSASAPLAGDAGAPPVAPVAAASTQAPLVLVVDDSITVRRVTQRLLKREGFRVALANDGLHALEVLAQEKPAVVLSDIEMPRMDGFDLVRNIRADAHLRDLPVIMITSRIAQKHREHALELGVDHYLGKPYSEDELLVLIRSYCAHAAEE